MGVIGLIILAGIVLLIIAMGQKSKADTARTADFYQKHSLIPVTEISASVYNSIGADKLYCRKGNVIFNADQKVPVLWCEWSLQSSVQAGSSRAIVHDYYFAIAFSSNTVSEEFAEKAEAYRDEKVSFSQKWKDAWVLNTERPIAVNKLGDGSLVIWWRAKNLAADYERAFAWLQNNMSVQEKETVLAPDESLAEEQAPTLPEIPRVPFVQFLQGMAEADVDKCMDILTVMDYIIMDYHDTKGHPSMSLEDYAQYLPMSLEEIKAANSLIREIEFPVQEYLEKGFAIPELIHYQYQLAYSLDFPGEKLTYLDQSQIFLCDSPPLTVYVR